MATLTDAAAVQVMPATSEAHWLADHRLAEVPVVDAGSLIAAHSRAVVIAPHPDDELLGCAGLLMHLSQAEREILVVAVSDGEKSHGSTSALSPSRLSRLRPAETMEALNHLGVTNMTILRTHLPDGDVHRHRDNLRETLCLNLRPDDTIFTTWQLDGHPDHEAVGQASHDAAHIVGSRLIEMPIWMWHWRTADHPAIPWKRARKLLLDERMQARKKSTLQCYRSQVEPDLSTGNAPILPPEVLAHFDRSFEIYFV